MHAPNNKIFTFIFRLHFHSNIYEYILSICKPSFRSLTHSSISFDLFYYFIFSFIAIFNLYPRAVLIYHHLHHYIAYYRAQRWGRTKRKRKRKKNHRMLCGALVERLLTARETRRSIIRRISIKLRIEIIKSLSRYYSIDLLLDIFDFISSPSLPLSSMSFHFLALFLHPNSIFASTYYFHYWIRFSFLFCMFAIASNRLYNAIQPISRLWFKNKWCF